ncbi:OmpA family protein [uncultured Flavobacterium sp.]|uniref:OmpA family protein n=1 Tax=uncultured Flavobacterium sp. TaxID=165435 RepID=UPI0030EDE497|tara:strand:- start:106129 stop:107919 length:1791 start_codon:yes stop_codon:yes gene_type:complete
MKKIKLIIIITLYLSQLTSINAQELQPIDTTSNVVNLKGFQVALRGGFDIPTFDNNTPYIDYKGGLMAGASVDYYFKWYGLGIDFDYIQNKPSSSYVTGNLYYNGYNVTSLNLTEDKITRNFIGIGPSFKYQPTNKYSVELKLRAGISSIDGGQTSLVGSYVNSSNVPSTEIFNYHNGYSQTNVFSAKGSLQFNYFVTNNLGLSVGGYYLKHFDSEESKNNLLNYTTSYKPITSVLGANNESTNQTSNTQLRENPCNCDVSSIGVFVGLVYKFTSDPNKPKKEKKKKEKVKEVYSLTVTARDKFTKNILPDTEVVLKNDDDEILKTGKTNSFGVVVFEDIEPDSYIIEGALYGINLETENTKKREFKKGLTLQKELQYTDKNFILNGKTVRCNTTSPLSDVSVVLRSLDATIQKNSITNEKGEYIFNLNEKTSFTIYGKKNNFFSQTETINTENYDRNTTLFVKLEICMEQVDCGKAIKLNNIQYDTDKYAVKKEAKVELNRLVQFLNDNPEINVELSSHTDSRGQNKYNQTLSQNRANAVVDYIVSQGIKRSRLLANGYGESQLLNECADEVECTEEQHQVNRRTEMKVICPDKK